jgi:RHS repeat-associated protein
LIADATGTTVWRRDNQEPFNDSPPDENPSGLGVFEFPLGFPGQYFDKETGNWYNGFRDYASSLGRYVQSDLIGLKGGLNTYAYAYHDPLLFIDPDGETPFTAAIGAAIGGVAGAIQAANQNGGWTWNNAFAITAGAATGAGAGALAGATPAGWGWLGATAAGAFAAFSGNAINQLAGDAPFSWCQAGTQAFLGAISGFGGWRVGLSSALGVVALNVPVTSLARPGLVQAAVTQGAVAGAVTSGAVQTILNLPVPTALGGFYPSSATCGCNF